MRIRPFQGNLKYFWLHHTTSVISAGHMIRKLMTKIKKLRQVSNVCYSIAISKEEILLPQFLNKRMSGVRN